MLDSDTNRLLILLMSLGDKVWGILLTTSCRNSPKSLAMSELMEGRYSGWMSVSKSLSRISKLDSMRGMPSLCSWMTWKSLGMLEITLEMLGTGFSYSFFKMTSKKSFLMKEGMRLG